VTTGTEEDLIDLNVNKTLVVATGLVVVGAGALVVGNHYIPWQTAAAWAAGDEERAAMLADYGFSLMEYASLFALMILSGLALMAYAAAPALA
jgi:hypothetical protein